MAIAELRTDDYTAQSVDVATPEGKKFLKKILKQDDWKIRIAHTAGKWQSVRAVRTVRGQLGEPDARVDVQLSGIEVMQCGRPGSQQSFSDSKPVDVVQPTRVCLTGSGEVRAFIECAINGARFRVSCSSGSTNSSEYGLSFYSLDADFGTYDFGIGGETIAMNGRTLVCGAVDIN